MTEIWFRHPVLQGVSPETGLPDPWLRRIEVMLAMPGNCRQHAIVVTTSENILPLSPEVAEHESRSAFRSGYLRTNRPPRPPLFRELKERLVARSCQQTTRREEVRRLADFLLVVWGHSDGSRDPCEELSHKELCDVLIHADNVFRVSMLWSLKQFAQMPVTPYPGKVQAFLQHVWPRQLALRLPELSEALVALLISEAGRNKWTPTFRRIWEWRHT
jgi:hypothetical protein